MAEALRKKAIWAWTMYDWGNSAFATTAEALADNSVIDTRFSNIFLSAIADFRGSKKTFMAFFIGLGVLSTALMFFVQQPDDWLLGSILYITGTIGFAGSLVFYDALLPHVANHDEIDYVSARGYAMGYIGGGLLLLINVIMIFFGPNLIPDMPVEEATALMMRLSLVSVAVWWAVFSIPVFRHVKEPQRMIQKGEETLNVITVGFKRFFQALAEISNFRDLFTFLLAFLVYSNGIGTIITMAVALGTDMGFGTLTLIGTLLLVQFVAAPFSILFGKLPKKLGLRQTINLSLLIYIIIAIIGFFMTKEWHFILLGLAVATVQGGSQALSRSLIGQLMPKSKTAEFYGFFSVSEKFNTVLGPLVFAVVKTITGNSRLAIISLVIFFLAGIVILAKVNIERGIQTAKAEDAKMISV